MSESTCIKQAIDTGSIAIEREGGITTVILAHQKRRNALNQDMCRQLDQVMVDLDRDQETVAIVLRGEGTDFSAGAALNDLESVLFALGEHNERIDYLSRADKSIRKVRKPTVALVRGVCMGGGWQIAAACDVILAADDCRIAITPSKLGILYPRPGLERLVERVGADRAKFLLYSGTEISPHQAENWGLVTALYPAESFEKSVTDFLETLVKRSQFSITTMKQLIDAPKDPELENLWRQRWDEFRGHQDLAHGRESFMAGQEPSFTWRLT